MALTDATALFRFLQRRGYIGESKEFPVGPLPNLLRMATPLTGVEMVEAPAAGVIAWNIRAGDHVNTGDVLGEIVDVADLDAPRIAVVSRTCGIVFGMRGHKLVRPGEIIVKVGSGHLLRVSLLKVLSHATGVGRRATGMEKRVPAHRLEVSSEVLCIRRRMQCYHLRIHIALVSKYIIARRCLSAWRF